MTKKLPRTQKNGGAGANTAARSAAHTPLGAGTSPRFCLNSVAESGDGAEVVSFIEGLAGSPMILLDWQKMLLADVFARRADGRRKHRTVSTGSVYRVLSSEAFTKKGLSPTCVIYDELPGSVKDA